MRRHRSSYPDRVSLACALVAIAAGIGLKLCDRSHTPAS